MVFNRAELYGGSKIKKLRLGFHYHTTYFKKDERFFMPGQIGIFLDELARNCDKLYLFLEEANVIDIDHDYEISGGNIEVVSLGFKSSFYKRLFWPGEKVRTIEAYVEQLDLLLLRAPSPIIPQVFRKMYRKIPVFLLIVGNYKNGIRGLQQPFLRKIAIILVLYIYNILQLLVIRNTSIFVNSRALYDTYLKHAHHTYLVKTTTLLPDSFYSREDTCEGSEIHVIYTGRINYQKGLAELVSAVAGLVDQFNIIIDIVGWEDPGTFSFIHALTDQARSLGIDDRLVFHGKKKIGRELNEFYRKSDIFVLPSYHEGFPRTIWEAMANSVPVICTPVGGIPYELIDQKDVFYVKVKDTTSLTNAIREIILNRELRRTLIQNAYHKSKQNTIEMQTKVLVSELTKAKMK